MFLLAFCVPSPLPSKKAKFSPGAVFTVTAKGFASKMMSTPANMDQVSKKNSEQKCELVSIGWICSLRVTRVFDWREFGFSILELDVMIRLHVSDDDVSWSGKAKHVITERVSSVFPTGP